MFCVRIAALHQPVQHEQLVPLGHGVQGLLELCQPGEGLFGHYKVSLRNYSLDLDKGK